MNSMPDTPAQAALYSGSDHLQMNMAKALARRLRREAVRDFDYGAASLSRSARRLHAALLRHSALRGGSGVGTPG